MYFSNHKRWLYKARVSPPAEDGRALLLEGGQRLRKIGRVVELFPKPVRNRPRVCVRPQRGKAS